MNQMSHIQSPPADVSFSGERSVFRKLVMRGAALELVTVGFYRFWLTTDMRRHLWAHTSVDGDAAEYTGKGRELLIGFLFALAIIIPIYIAYFIVSIEAERIRAFASVPLVAFFYVFGQFAVYRARRYRLTRTVWRGVRFWMDGSGWGYAMRASLWALLVPLTLGLILPWREAALERYKMRHSFYGDLQGSFEGRGWDFFKRGWWLWLLAGLSFLTMRVPYLSLLVLVAAPFIYGAFKAIEWRWWVSGIRFGEAGFESSLTRGALTALYWKAIGWVILLVLGFAAFSALCAFAVAGMSGLSIQQFFETPKTLSSVPLLVLGGVGYLILVLAIGVVTRVYLQRDLWVRIVASTVVHNMEATDNVSVQGELASALGEGFADGFDVAGF